ncbi:hypothetical protein H8K66_07915 [Klebsiella pneumoniae]|nr:hypothetical protein [Klebsiella pneumoniae]MBC5214538.1 hypothetical protein [Klebsiella pneumoniae]
MKLKLIAPLALLAPLSAIAGNSTISDITVLNCGEYTARISTQTTFTTSKEPQIFTKLTLENSQAEQVMNIETYDDLIDLIQLNDQLSTSMYGTMQNGNKNGNKDLYNIVWTIASDGDVKGSIKIIGSSPKLYQCTGQYINSGL